ncbi:hypothetical protein G6R30_06160 [Fructobacillus sp. S1-1]|uniref:Uncharacterized protein n=1 Tax=Fructobacillus parabroussonetiae TaxID=2713174 RepID=A0ABS5QXU7_9LACO|nr:hypothetical protein [Fructobacillus parabroussonetiae]
MLITPIEKQYAFIIFEAPPTLSVYTVSLIVASIILLLFCKLKNALSQGQRGLYNMHKSYMTLILPK